MTVGDRIKKIRELFQITSNEFADLTGIHPVTIRKYETNKMKPSNEHIEKMCESLHLPRMIFEGIPEQYTNYNYTGDFFQQLFLMLNNNTLTFHSKNDTQTEHITLNPLLDNYLTLTINGSEVALNDVNIQLKYDRLKPVDVHHFMSYIKKTEAISDNDEQSKDYIDNASLELMLIGHSWQDYMKGMGTPEERDADLQKILDNGGTFFDYIDQLEGPESLKNKLREAYCEARIEEYIKPLLDPYPIHGSYDEKDNWAKKKVNLVQKYKKDHPDYLQEIIQEEINKRK